MELRELCEAIQAAWERVALLEKDECDSKPGSPAKPEDIERLLEAHGDVLPADYIEFLQIHDGWEHIAYGHNLCSVDELLGEMRGHFEEIKEDLADDFDEDLGELVGLLWSENDGHIMYVDSAGQLVEHCYEELGRYATFREFLEERLEEARDWLETSERERKQLVGDLDPEFRRKVNAEVEARAIEALRLHQPAPPPSVDLSVVPEVMRSMRWGVRPHFEAEDEHVCLTLSLYLAFAPTSEELRNGLRVWREWSEWGGPVRAGRYRHYPHPEKLSDPDDEESWAELVDSDPADARYGFVWIEGEGSNSERDVRAFSIRVVSETRGEEGYAHAAPLCLATFPADTDPSSLPRLAKGLLEVLPVRSGVGGFQARYQRYPNRCYDWCRQYFALDLQDPDMVYAPLREGVRGAGWLTILGSTLGRAYKKAGQLETSGRVTLTACPGGGLIFRAGDEPELRHIVDGLPEGVAEVDALLRPLKIASASSTPKTHAFKFFEISDSRYGPWLYRFVDPTRFLTPTAYELAGIADEVKETWPEEQLIDLARVARLVESEDGAGLARALYSAGWNAKARGLLRAARALYEAALPLPDCSPQTYGNLIVVYSELGELEMARAFADAHLEGGDCYVYVNSACIYCELGDHERALELLKKGFELGFDRREAIRYDSSLKPLRDDPRFLALFED